LRVGNPLAPQFVFFGTEYSADDPTRIVIPIEVLAGFFFLAVALVMIGPGQELGRAFNRQGNRLRAYSLNIAGSLAGILLFAACSFWELSPIFWFAPVVLALAYFVFASASVRHRPERWRLLPWVAPALARRARHGREDVWRDRARHAGCGRSLLVAVLPDRLRQGSSPNQRESDWSPGHGVAA
jgi:hypothetical protein